MQRLFDLTGKSILIAGGSGHFGKVICESLAAHGGRVMVADLREDAAKAVADAINEQGGEAASCRLDVGDNDSIAAAVDATAKSFGPIDVMANCAYYVTGKPHDQLTSEDWQACLRVTLTGSFEMSRAVAGPMLERGGGSIIHFSSMYGVVSPDPAAYPPPMNANPPDYGAAKAGVLQLMRYQAVQWARQGVRVNAVIPGPFPHPGLVAEHPDFIQQLNQRVPMGRIGKAQEIAASVVYLASDDASFVTGTALTVDGGWTAW